MNKELDAIVISPNTNNKQYWLEVWKYRELFFFLAWRDISVRYKQTLLGIMWVVIRPLITMLVFTIVFGYIAKLPSANVAYPVLVLSGMLVWQLFSSTLADAANSIVGNAHIVTKVYFPRIILPLSTALTNLLDFIVGFFIFTIIMICYSAIPGWHIAILPIFIFLTLACAIGLSLWVAIINVKYRDFRFIMAFAIQLSLYISPIGFNLDVIPEKWQLVYSLNPLVGLIEGFRWSLIENFTPNWMSIKVSIIMTVVLLITGLNKFKKAEVCFADDL